jgi:hypothetical protein
VIASAVFILAILFVGVAQVSRSARQKGLAKLS